MYLIKKRGEKMKLYIIETQYRQKCYVIADSIENAVKIFKQNSDLGIIDIQFISQNVFMGENNE